MARTVTPSETRCEMTWIVMPGQSNALGTVFGGEVMAWIDVCAAVAAQRFARCDVVTAAMDSLLFKAPIHNGDIAVLQAQVNWAGRTSMEVGVRVEAENPYTGERTHTSTAYVTFVAVDKQGVPCQIPELLLPTETDRRRHGEAGERRAIRLEAKKRAMERA